ncbi:hypothetical protein F4818DRAFT_441691 [Hypoxylon cercidicola]|nr:hypothetical protein F4818DRAFT_441691 [Hypoxylon cercidicola]
MTRKDPNQQRLHPARTFPSNRTWLVTKLALTSLSIASCIIVLGISIELAVDPAVQSYIAVWTAPQAGAALLWSVADLVTSCAQRPKSSHRSIHPGAHVAVQLLLWLGFGAGLGLTTHILTFALDFTAEDDPVAYPEYHAYYYGDNDYEYYSNSYVHSMEALVAFLALLIIIHVFLFARACVETIKRYRTTNMGATIELQQTRLSSKDKLERESDVEPNMA